jgi:hypothetical protein
MYDRVDKFCQWQRPEFDDNLDAYDHPQGKMPVCEKLFHGYPKGSVGSGRDYQMVYDCLKGDKDPTCKECITIDSVPRCSEGWDKVYSGQTESCQAPDKRMERHAKCGSYIRLESETGKSVEYSEGRGHIRIGNATKESEKKGHLNFQGEEVSGCTGVGTWDIHTSHEECALAAEQTGVRVACVRPEDMQVDWAFEAKDFESGAYIRIMKSGDIRMYSPGTIYETADVSIIQTSPLIDQVTKLVHNYGSEQIDVYCTHTDCTCHGSGQQGGDGAWEAR